MREGGAVEDGVPGDALDGGGGGVVEGGERLTGLSVGGDGGGPTLCVR